MIAANYADAGIALRHLEGLAAATLVASSAAHAASLAAAEAAGRPILDELAATSLRGVSRPGRGARVRRLLPARRPRSTRSRRSASARGRPPAGRRSARRRDRRCRAAVDRARSPTSGRSRGCSPGRRPGSSSPAGSGSAPRSRRYAAAHGEAGIAALGRLYARWPFLASLLDNAELALARADLGVGRQYAALAGDAGDRSWAAIEAEYARTVAWLGRLTGRDRLLDDEPELRRRLGLRDPYVDSLSEMQVTLLAPPPRLPARRPGTRAAAPARPADRQRDRGRPPADRLTRLPSLLRDDDQVGRRSRRSRPCSSRRPRRPLEVGDRRLRAVAPDARLVAERRPSPSRRRPPRSSATSRRRPRSCRGRAGSSSGRRLRQVDDDGRVDEVLAEARAGGGPGPALSRSRPAAPRSSDRPRGSRRARLAMTASASGAARRSDAVAGARRDGAHAQRRRRGVGRPTRRPGPARSPPARGAQLRRPSGPSGGRDRHRSVPLFVVIGECSAKAARQRPVASIDQPVHGRHVSASRKATARPERSVRRSIRMSTSRRGER